jgi:hypothetical protein
VLVAVLVGTLGPAGAARAGIIYTVTVNTSALQGTAGNLDFQFNPGNSSAEAATATVQNFQKSGGVLAGTSATTGDATGVLAGTLTLDNGTAFNDIFQGFTFGTQFSFQLTLSGPAVSTPGGTVGSSFVLSLYDSAGVTPLLTTDPNGSVLTLDLNPNGSATAHTFPDGTGGGSVIAVAPVTSVPEPSALVLLLSAGPAGLGFLLRRRRA